MAPPDTTPPTLSAIAPVDQATSVPVNTYVVLQFSEAMNQASVESNLRFNGSAFSGTYTWSADGRTVRFARSTNFAATTAYDLSFAAAPTDLAGNALGSIARSFTTGGGVDGTAATVSSTVPTAGDDDYQPLSGCTFFRIRNGVVITFSSPVDRVSVTSAFAVLKGTTPVPGALSFSSDSRTLTFTPSATLDFNTTYTVRLNDGGLIAQDLYRNPIANLSYTFKTLRSITTNIFSTASGSGRILSAAVSGQSTVALNSSVRVGEFNNSTRSRGIYQFNVNLPAATTCVTGATLTIEQTGTNGSPYGGTSLGDVVAEVIDTEASVDATDYAKPKLTTGAGILDSTTVTVSTDATSGNKAAEVVGLVRALRAAPTPGNVRFRLRFTNDGASSGAVDYTQFQNSGARLQVRYEAP